ncbi:MAG: ComEC/Rec2 family competence protein [Lewinellaceae bacterium]|nr:ComEC/Rec2 family competence protein [Lewinellaceae bacterium]
MNWREFPLARLLLPLLLGIGTEGVVPEWLQWGALSILISLLALLAFWQRPGWRFSRRWWFGFATHFWFFLLGFLLVHFHDERRRPSYPFPALAEEALFLGRVNTLEPTGSKLRLSVGLQSVADTSGVLRKVAGRLLVYLDITSQARQLQPGDLILFDAVVLPVPPPLNPRAFDYRRYLHYQNTHYQAFVDEENWKLLEHRPSFANRAQQLRHACLRVLQRHLPTKNEYAVAAALILGYKAELSDETRNAYAHTGAMHVLAVSGLHVGIIQLLLSFLLGRLRLSGPYWPVVRTVLLLASIWAFAMITGASPSVLRAATLFSFLSVGQALQRYTNIYNTLAASAFLLLCIDPYLLYNIGFQLSYLAVLGIVYFQPILYRQWYIENRVGDYLWKLLAVSLAAQLTTLPLSLFYFHQFPLYFWLSGLVVVPAAALILSSGLALFVLHLMPFAGMAIGKLLYGITWMVNALIFLIQQIPGSLLEGFWIGPWLVGLMYLSLLGIVAGRETRKFKWVLGALACLQGIAALNAVRSVQVEKQRVLTVYHIPRATALGVYEGRDAALFCNEKLARQQLEYACRNHQWYLRARPPARLALTGNGDGRSWWFRDGALQYGPHRLLAVEDRRLLSAMSVPDVDILLLCNGVDAGLEELRQKVNFRLLLIDGSSPPWKAHRWMEEARELGIDCHYTGEDGAWVGEW